jgi:hypothetical protein
VIFHDELEEIQLGLPTRLYTLDLADLRAPTVQVSHAGPTSTTDHNGYVRGTSYYVSHYRRGVVVYDAANPNALVEIASFDNYVNPSSNIPGTDGAWVFIRSCHRATCSSATSRTACSCCATKRATST